MVEGLLGKQEKPSNTEVLGLLMDPEKIKFITKLTHENIEGLSGLRYWTKSIFSDEPIEQVTEELIEDILALKTAVNDKKGNRADQIVDALKHIIEDEKQDDLKNLAQQIKS